MSTQEELVKTSLSKFLKDQDADASISAIDEIVLSYMVGVLEELGMEEGDDAFDIETFTEMMEAYLPGFSSIESGKVCDWMFDLANKLGEHRNPDMRNGKLISSQQNLLDQQEPVHTKQHDPTLAARQEVSKKRQCSESSESSDPGATSQDHGGNDQVKVLLEMFPASCGMEVSHCLSLAGGDLDKAAQLVLHRQECGDSIIDTLSYKTKKPSAKKKTVAVLDDKKVKQEILARYSYIDTDDDKKEHKPMLPKKEPKKMTRYLDNKVVTTKGERFTEIKKNDDETQPPKAQFLKPLRQYRFH